MEIKRNLLDGGTIRFSFPMIDSASRPDYKSGLNGTFNTTTLWHNGTAYASSVASSVAENLSTGTYTCSFDTSLLTNVNTDYPVTVVIGATGADEQTVIIKHDSSLSNNVNLPVEIRRFIKGNTADAVHTSIVPIIGSDGEFVSGRVLNPAGNVDYRFFWNDGGQWLSTILAVGLSEIDNTGVYQLQILNTDNATFQASYDQTFPIIIKLYPSNGATSFVPVTIAFTDDSLANNDISNLALEASVQTVDSIVDTINANIGTPYNLGTGPTIKDNLKDLAGQDFNWTLDSQHHIKEAINANDLTSVLDKIDEQTANGVAYECYRDIKGPTGFKFMFPLRDPSNRSLLKGNVNDGDVKMTLSYRADGNTSITEELLGESVHYEFYDDSVAGVGQYGIGLLWQTLINDNIGVNYNDLEGPLQFKIEPMDPNTVDFDIVTVIVSDVSILFGAISDFGSGAKIGSNLVDIFSAAGGSSVGYANGAIWIDSEVPNVGTDPYIDGVADNPVSEWGPAEALSISTGLRRFEIAQGSYILFTGNVEKRYLNGIDYTLDPNGVMIDDVAIRGAIIPSGVIVGNGGQLLLQLCQMGDVEIPTASLIQTGLGGTLTFNEVGFYFLDYCTSAVAGAGGTPVIDLSNILAGSQINLRHYSGGIKFVGLKAGDVVSIEGDGQVVFDSTCTGGAVAIRGNFDLTDNTNGGAGGAITITQTARFGSKARLYFEKMQILSSNETALEIANTDANSSIDAFKITNQGSGLAARFESLKGDSVGVSAPLGKGVRVTSEDDALSLTSVSGLDINARGIVPEIEGLSTQEFYNRLANFFGGKLVRDKSSGNFTFYKISDENTVSFVMNLEKTGVLDTRTIVP